MPDDPHFSIKEETTYGVRYRKMRKRAFARSQGVCQACGMAAAKEAHHWSYPDPDKLGPEHLIAVCAGCHEMITTVRRQPCAAAPAALKSNISSRRQSHHALQDQNRRG